MSGARKCRAAATKIACGIPLFPNGLNRTVGPTCIEPFSEKNLRDTRPDATSEVPFIEVSPGGGPDKGLRLLDPRIISPTLPQPYPFNRTLG